MTRTHRSNTSKPFRLTKAKKATLELLAEYYCLRTNDIAQLIRHRNPNENDRRSIRHTLGLLYKDGLVNRLPYLDLNRENGSVTYVYGLSDKGLGDLSGKAFTEHSQRTLDHELEIAYFHIALKQFCREQGFPLYWQQKDLKRTVSPDALFAITNPKKLGGKDTLYYFLELERAKVGNYRDGQPSIIRKLSKYYGYYNSDKCGKEWGSFRRFRTIIVQRTEQRRANLLKELEGKYRHRMFWLTTEALYKQDMSGRIFQTPRDFREGALYSFRN
jgi:hypothetical protein